VALAEWTDGSVSFGGTSSTAVGIASGIFLAVAEANGVPRLGREVAHGEWGLVGAAVDPAGRSASCAGSAPAATTSSGGTWPATASGRAG
jgi:hypothetical protein